jgi:heme/copper-type cytochrome/quinol oxidase subunit 2
MAKVKAIIAVLEIVTSFLVVFSVCFAVYLRFRRKRGQARDPRSLQ